MKRLLQLAMDGPNVNKKVFKDLTKYLSELHPDHPELLDLGVCPLHTVHNSFKTAIKATSWDLIEFLRAIYNVFKKSPARKADYTYYTKSKTFPLKFCGTRWLNNVTVAKRALQILPNLSAFVEKYDENKKSPLSASFKIMVSGVADELMGPKLAFFQQSLKILSLF